MLRAAVLAALICVAFIRPARPAFAQAGGPRLLEATGGRLVFELAVPQPVVETIVVEGRAFQRLALAGYTAVGQSGQPELLQTGVVIGVPPTGAVSVRVVEQATERLPGVYRLYPVPASEALLDPQTGQPDALAGPQERFVWDRAAYNVDAFLPAQVVAVDQVGWVRQQRVARIVVQPVQFNPAQGIVQVTRHLRVEVAFDEPGTEAVAAAAAADEAFEPLLAGWLLNYQQSRKWRLARPAAPAFQETTLPRPGDDQRPWLKVTVRESGLHRVSAADLRAAGMDMMAAADPARLQVWRDDHQVAADFLGNADGRFGPDEVLVFYAHWQPSIYSLDTVYWLTVGDEPGLRMTTADAHPYGIAAATQFTATARLEEDKIFQGDLPQGGVVDAPRWYWRELSSVAEDRTAVPVALPGAVTTGYEGSLAVRLVGRTSLGSVKPDHQVRLALNGRTVGDMVWDGATVVSTTLRFPANWLAAGQNTVELSLPGELPGVTLDRVYLDWLALTYRQSTEQVQERVEFTATGQGATDLRVGRFAGGDVVAYDVTDPAAPQRLVGLVVAQEATTGAWTASTPLRPLASSDLAHRAFLPMVWSAGQGGPAEAYVVHLGLDLDTPRRLVLDRVQRLRPAFQLTADHGSQWRSPDHQADYLLIYHESLAAAAQALADYRRSTGLTVALVDVQDVFDEFSSGQVDPGALRDFISYAYHYWRGPAPAYVLLLGDGHYDLRLVTGLTTGPSLIPPYYACFDSWLCEVASDNEFVAVSGDDRLPDLAIGRLTVRDAESAARSVAKIIAYETEPPAGDWRRAAAFIADNYRDASGRADAAGNFEYYTEVAAATLPDDVTVHRVFYDPYPVDDGNEDFRFRTPAAATAAIVDVISQGQLFVSYIGHAAINVWAHEWLLVGKSSVRNDVAAMTNGPRLAIFLDMTCLSGNFADVVREAMQETLLNAAGGGSVAGWAGTGFGVAQGHDRLHSGLFRAVYDQGVTRLGLATVAGKQALWAADGEQHADLLDTFALIGDPALRIALPVAPDRLDAAGR